MKPLDVDIDGILGELGNYGRYNVKNFIFLASIPVILSSLHASNYIFTAYEPAYRCRIPDCDGNSSIFDQPWLSSGIPKGAKCERFGANSSWIGDPINEICPANYFNQSIRLRCDEGYVYEDEKTLIEELDIPCEIWKRTLLGTLHSVGTLFALPFIGTFSDKFGRLHTLIISAVIEGTLGIIKGLSVSYGMFAAMEVLEPTLGSGVYTSIYVLLLEFLTPETRVTGGCLVNIYFGIGQVLMGLAAFGIPYWRTYLFVIYAPSYIMILYYWLYEESPRWLLSKHRYQETKKVLEKIAKTNGKTISNKVLENLNYNIENIEHIKNTNEMEAKEKEISPWAEVIKSKILILRVFTVSVWWITCTFCFYGLSINSTILPGNRFVNFIIVAATEIPAHVLAYFGMAYVGRKKTLFTCFLFGGACLLAFPFIPSESLQWLLLLTYFAGKLFVTAAFNGVYLYTSELFPTTLRHSLLATCSMVGRIGSIAAPQTPYLAEITFPELPTYLFAGSCLISALLMLTSPETIGLPLPETVEEAENISQSRRNLLDDST